MPAPNPQSLWYIARNGQQQGPMLIHEVHERFRTGQVAPTDHMWCAEVGNWILASDVFGGAPPPPPPPQASVQAQPAPLQVPRRMEAEDGRGSISGGKTDRKPAQRATTQTVVEGGSFKFSTFIFLVLGVVIPLWPISLPICWFLAYRSYNKPTVKTVRVVSQEE